VRPPPALAGSGACEHRTYGITPSRDQFRTFALANVPDYVLARRGRARTATDAGGSRFLSECSCALPERCERERSGLEQRLRDSGDAEQAGADVGADDGADLRHQLRFGAEDLAPALDELLCLLGRLDVLDGPRSGAVGLALVHVADHPLERAARGSHALDGRDRPVDGQDRLDLQRPAEPRLGAAD